MTGVLDRLRAWLGFGGADGTGDHDPATSDAPEERVVHRDDRPLETPTTMDRPEPPSASSRPARGEGPDAEANADDPTAPAEVSIPDAEATGTATHGDGVETPVTDAADGPETGEPDAPADGVDAAFACSVCGTTVDDPSAPCPLCRSTDVVPVTDVSTAVEGDETSARGGQTEVSSADDDAVERLRDVKEGE